jgi:hypothetical protein
MSGSVPFIIGGLMEGIFRHKDGCRGGGGLQGSGRRIAWVQTG